MLDWGETESFPGAFVQRMTHTLTRNPTILHPATQLIWVTVVVLQRRGWMWETVSVPPRGVQYPSGQQALPSDHTHTHISVSSSVTPLRPVRSAVCAGPEVWSLPGAWWWSQVLPSCVCTGSKININSPASTAEYRTLTSLCSNPPSVLTHFALIWHLNFGGSVRRVTRHILK